MDVFGCKLSLFRLCDGDFGTTPVYVITIGITCAAFCFHIAHVSFASSWYMFCLSVIVLARLCVFGTAMSNKKVFFVFLFMRVTSGRLEGIVLSVIMLRLQYSLKLSFSSALAGVYLYYRLLSSISSAASASFWWITFATPSCLFTYSVGVSGAHAAVMCWIVSDSFPRLLHSLLLSGCFKIYFL
jgi:hypothetical protein